MNFYEEENIAIAKPFPILIFCLGVFGIPAVTTAFLGDYVTAGLLFITGLGCWIGFRTGALKALASIALVIGAIYVAPQYIHLVEPKLVEWFEVQGLSRRIISLAVVVFAIGIILTGIVSLFSWMAIKKGSRVESFNKGLGLILGGTQAAVGTVLLLGGFLVIAPTFDQEKIAAAGEKFESISDVVLVSVDDVSERTKTSLIGPLLIEHNPFTKYPQYNPLPKIQKTVELLNDPSQINNLLNDKVTLEKLHASDAFTAAAKRLSLDPAVQEILSSDGPPSSKQILGLLNSQSVLEILDEPGVMDEATRIMKDSATWGEQLSAN